MEDYAIIVDLEVDLGICFITVLIMLFAGEWDAVWK